jgi:plastocyanin
MHGIGTGPSPSPAELLIKRGENYMTRFTLIKVGLVAAGLVFAGAAHEELAPPPASVQVVALDECDPATFNTALGPDFCKNVTLGAFTVLPDLISKAQAGTPDPGWDFEPDALTIKQGTTVNVVDQGGEPHTFTEVAHFGGGFVPPLNMPGETTVPECAGGFSTVAVARTRILQGSQLQVTGLSKGEHDFQCCIHPWMRLKIEVK